MHPGNELQNTITLETLPSTFKGLLWTGKLVAVLHNPWLKVECIMVITGMACMPFFFLLFSLCFFYKLYVPTRDIVFYVNLLMVPSWPELPVRRNFVSHWGLPG